MTHPNIPKTIHYCWFGRTPLTRLGRKCISSWRKYLPDYEIKEWNEDNFDVNIIPYVKEAYEAKKYAFVSDYARFWILYHYGGLYFDTDVEIIRNMDDIISRGPFMGRENEFKKGADTVGVAPGLGLGCYAGHGLYKEILDFYQPLHFVNPDGSLNLHTVVEYTTSILLKHGLQDKDEIQESAGVYIYPKEYFCPKSYDDLVICKTDNSVSIHHFAASWMSSGAQKKHRKDAFLLRHPLIGWLSHHFDDLRIRLAIRTRIKKIFH